MKTAAARILVWICLMGLGLVISQDGGDQTGKTGKDFRIRVGVEEVRIDAVVLDNNGHQITDLSANDFEVFQDGARQAVLSSKYINEYNPQPEVRSGSSRNPKAIPALPTPMLTQDEIRRTFVFLVNNSNMSFVQVSDARMAMQRFVDTQMQPGDLVAIVTTGYGSATPFQIFTSDKRHILAMIYKVRWLGTAGTGFYTSPMMSLSYCIDALKDLPGRKYLIQLNYPIGDAMGIKQMEDRYNSIGDAALRAGVVIH